MYAHTNAFARGICGICCPQLARPEWPQPFISPVPQRKHLEACEECWTGLLPKSTIIPFNPEAASRPEALQAKAELLQLPSALLPALPPFCLRGSGPAASANNLSCAVEACPVRRCQ